LPLTFFTAYYLQGIIARECGDPDAILTAVAHCRSLESIAKLPPCAAALAMLEVDGLLERSSAGDEDAAASVAATLAGKSVTTGLIGWSDCKELTRARVAARLRKQDARLALRAALDRLEEHARLLALDCD